MNNLKKKLENIWYYYKTPIIIVVFILVCVLSVTTSSKKEEEYDHNIALISVNYPTEEECIKIREAYSKHYGGTFGLTVYNVKLTELNQDQILISKLDLDLRNTISEYLLIEDLDAFKKATNDLKIYEVTLVSNIDWLKGLGADNLYFATRK